MTDKQREEWFADDLEQLRIDSFADPRDATIADLTEKLAAAKEGLREIAEKDDAGDMLYRADGPCAKIARALLIRLGD
jgi:hypothetical protein